MGVRTATIILQQVAGVNTDGVTGLQTIKAANTISPVKLIQDYAAIRMLRYTNTKNFDTYGRGWTRRVFSIVTSAITSFSVVRGS
jgi:lysozyme family protein